MWSLNYHYIIVGGGLAGLQLALELNRDIFFKGKSIAIIDPDSKEFNDKTWCYWEKGEGKWDELVTAEWEKARFVSSRTNKLLHLGDYRYKMLRSIDFYSRAKEELEETGNFHFIKDKISKIDPVKMAAVGAKKSYTATHFFDSRIHDDYQIDTLHTKIFQHFKGWMINTANPVFDPSAFTMMDFRLKYRDSTSFIYVLPLSETKALVEFTFFTPELIDEDIYDQHLQDYIEKILKVEDYEITETEKGIIPMTDYPFHEHSVEKITKIGTGGSWVKGSTGYSLKHTERKIKQILENIKSGENPSLNLFNNRHRFYDAIFLDVLKQRNDLGEKLFSNFYKRNTPEQIFKFLDEETEIREDLPIMWSMYHPQFIRSFFRKI